MNREIDPQRNICTTVGAQEALHNILTAHCDPGDEVVVLTPAYDAYFKAALLQDLTIKTIALEYDEEQLHGTNGAMNANHYVLNLDVSDLMCGHSWISHDKISLCCHSLTSALRLLTVPSRTKREYFFSTPRPARMES